MIDGSCSALLCWSRTATALLKMIEISIVHQLGETLGHSLSSECPSDRGYPRQ